MENTANNTYSHQEFDILLSDSENRKCFDCGLSPASWASVNNSIYLCLDCAGIHRSFGVNISYIRSNIIDKWNETQITFLKVGGNKRLRELLNLYEVPTSTPKENLYNSKLLEYHRNQIKNDVTNGGRLVMPILEDCLNPIESKVKQEQTTTNKNYYSIGNSADATDSNKNTDGYLSYFGSVFSTAYEKGMEVASTVKDKVNDMDITNKIIKTGSRTIEVLKDTGNVVKEQGSKTVDAIRDTTTKVIHKGFEVGVGYFI
jgi:hypothetical protein